MCVKLDMTCENCVTDKRGVVVRECGPCEEQSIKDRIRWWQDGKAALREREKNFSQALRACIGGTR